jgi:hypothetical protein
MGKNERRRTERQPIGPGYNAELIGVNVPVTLVNIGIGGFALASDRLLPAATRLEARFTDADKTWSTSLTARVAYSVSQPIADGDDRGKYITGFAFVDADLPAVKRRIQEFISNVMLQAVEA